MGFLEGHEEGIVIQPGGLTLAEGVELVGVHAGKPPRCAGEHIEARLVQRAVVYAVGLGAPGAAGVLRAVEKAFGGEVVEVDEVGIARIRGKRLVGRIAVARGHDG